MSGDTPVSTMQRALARLDAIDPVAGGDARAALAWLLGSDPDVDVVRREEGDSALDTMSRFALQQFCWYELPFKWIVAPSVAVEIVRALGRFFDLASMPRYGELCRSTTTLDVLAAWEEGATAGFRAFRQAMEHSGLEPPPLIGAGSDELRWSTVMDTEEFAAFWSTALALELAVDAGVVVPGAPGWRVAQMEVVRAHLHQPRDERLGESLFQAIASERLVHWIERGDGGASRSEARKQFLVPLTNALLTPVPQPRGVTRAFESLSWLLAQVEHGVTTTAKGALPRALVIEGVVAHPRWWPTTIDRSPRREDEVPALALLHRFAIRAGLVRRRGRSLVLTERGQAARAERSRLWRAVTDHLVHGPTLEAAAMEVHLAGLLAEPLVDPVELAREVQVVLTECGWQRGAPGEPLSGARLAPVLAEAELLLTELGVVRSRGRHANRRLRLTAFGHSTALAALRARALSPHER